jgi:hypothetical protein
MDKDEIKKRAATLLTEHGPGIAARGDIILALMEEFGISDQSACQYLAFQRRIQQRFSRKGRSDAKGTNHE